MAAATEKSAFFASSVEVQWDETRGLVGLRLSLPAELAAAHRAVGQVVKVQTPAGEGYFAIASAPSGDRKIALLIKRGGALGDAVVKAAERGTLEVSAPFGPGFPLVEAEGRDLFLFAAGSGIAPVRAVIEAVLAARPRYGRLALFYGHRNDEDFAYRAEHPAWEAAGVRVVLCASQPSHGWDGERGYVQDVAHSLAFLELDRARAVAFLCGGKEMVLGVRKVLVEAGLALERTHLNF